MMRQYISDANDFMLCCPQHQGLVMSLTAPKERKYLSADALFGLLRNTFAQVPDHCSADAGIPLRDALMSGFAMFSLICGVQEYVESMARRPGNSIQQGSFTPHILGGLQHRKRGATYQFERKSASKNSIFEGIRPIFQIPPD